MDQGLDHNGLYSRPGVFDAKRRELANSSTTSQYAHKHNQQNLIDR